MYSDFFNQLLYEFLASFDNSPDSNLNPCSMANCCAPSPTNITCGVFSITRRATDIGCLIRSKNATLPQLNS